jgi:hypothetical protein
MLGGEQIWAQQIKDPEILEEVFSGARGRTRRDVAR